MKMLLTGPHYLESKILGCRSIYSNMKAIDAVDSKSLVLLHTLASKEHLTGEPSQGLLSDALTTGWLWQSAVLARSAHLPRKAVLRTAGCIG
jgi:hypothetical protein